MIVLLFQNDDAEEEKLESVTDQNDEADEESDLQQHDSTDGKSESTKKDTSKMGSLNYMALYNF